MTRQIIDGPNCIEPEAWDDVTGCILPRLTRKRKQENYEIAEGLRNEFVRDQ